MESTLEVVLRKVLATEEGVQDLRSRLLDLTVKSHEVIIQKLEERMNELAFQMETPIEANNTTPRKDMIDGDGLEWEMEEEAIEEQIVDVSMKAEELEEIYHVHKESNRRSKLVKRGSSIGRISALMDSSSTGAPIPSSALNVRRRIGEPTGESAGKSTKRRSTVDLAGRIVFQASFTDIHKHISLKYEYDQVVVKERLFGGYLDAILQLANHQWWFASEMLRCPVFYPFLTQPAIRRVRQQLLKLEDHTETFPRLTSVWVRGQEVQVTPEEINSLYWEELISLHPILPQKIENKENQFQWVAQVIAQGQPQWAMSKGLIHRRDLKFDARMCLDLVYFRLMPSRNTPEQEVTKITAHTNQPTPCDPEAVPQQVEAPRSPPVDWWVGYHNNADIMSYEEEHHHSPPPPPQMHSLSDVDPLWAQREWLQHLIMSFKPSKIDGLHQALVYLSHSHHTLFNLQ
ncbi:hypothetical protein HAX54_012563 [Datura stramonium]|uniref:Uncharacterized protein n=1 Tax=Datura stramonium TaxID=4076 RepID=A0ABS8TMU7_DATST|nr:hypothetical protein [Datura stramonium]